jgi:hypothetical protein
MIPCMSRVSSRCSRVWAEAACCLSAQDGGSRHRAFIALSGDDDLCPLPQVQLGEGELDEALESVWSGEQALTSVFRENERGEPTLIAQGYEHEVPMSMEVEGKPREWSERRLVVRSVRHAEAALESAVRRLGWRIYTTNQPAKQLSLEQAVLAYRSEYLVERSLGRLKVCPLSLTPMYVQRDDSATGLIRLLTAPTTGVAVDR